MQEGGDVMSDLEGRPPVTVSEPRFPGKRAGEAGHGQPRAEPTVWTARMLAALAQGVKGMPLGGPKARPEGRQMA